MSKIDFIEKTIERLRYQRSIWWKRTSDFDPTKEELPIVRRRTPNKDEHYDLLGMDRRNIALLGGVGGMAALLSAINPSEAMADQAFTAFPWPVTGSSTTRTAPARGIDMYNAKDWGAVGNGLTNDQPQIQAAVDAFNTSASRGMLFFPPAQANQYYNVANPINMLWGKTGGTTPSLVVMGCGGASKVAGTVDHGYIFARDATTYSGFNDKGLFSIEKLYVNNFSTTSDSGAILITTSVASVVRDCQIGGQNGIIFQGGLDGASPLFIFTSTIENCALTGKGKGGTATGTGIALSQGCTVIGCDITAFFVGARCYGASNNIIGGRFEVNDTAITTGIDIDGNTGNNGSITIVGPSFESNNVGIDLSHGGGFVSIKDCSIGALDGLGINGMLFSDSGGKWITLENVQVTGGYSGYAITCQWDPSRGSSCIRTFINVNASNTHDPTRSWLLTSGCGIGIPKFINCNNPDLTSTFTNLPSGGAWQVAQGDTYFVSDSPTAASTNFGATVSAGSSSNLVALRAQQTAKCQLGIISDGGTAAEFIGTVGARFTGQMTTSTSMTVTLTNGWIAAGDTVTGGSGLNAISVTIVSGPGGDGTYVTSANANATTTAQSCIGASTNLHVTAVMQGTITNGDTLSGSSFAGEISGIQDRTITGVGSGGGVGDYPISLTATTTVTPSTNSVFTATISDGLGGAGTILNITAIIAGSTVAVGSIVTGAGVTAGTRIVKQLTSANPLSGGGIGTYTVSNSLNVASETMTGTKMVLGSGTPGTVLTPAGTQTGTFVGSGMQITALCGTTSNINQRWVTSTTAGGSKWNLTAIAGGAGASKFRGPGEVYGTLWVID